MLVSSLATNGCSILGSILIARSLNVTGFVWVNLGKQSGVGRATIGVVSPQRTLDIPRLGAEGSAEDAVNVYSDFAGVTGGDSQSPSKSYIRGR